MADRFPLIVNEFSKKIEELVAGDNLDLSGNGIIVSGDTGAGKYLTSNGSVVSWGSPGDVYLTATQTISNKTLTSCSLSATLNTITNIPNSSLVNSGITVNGTAVALGGSINTADTNTTYSISASDGANSSKLFSLDGSDSTNVEFGIAVGSPPSIPVGSNEVSFTLSRTDTLVTISATAVDTNTITTLQGGSSGNAVTGTVIIEAGLYNTVSQNGNTITITGQDTDTITKLRATDGESYAPGDWTFLEGNTITLTQGTDSNNDPTITIASTDTITRLKGGTNGSLVTGDVTISGGSGGNVTVSQSGNTISIDSTDTNTVTKVAGNSEALAAGDFRFLASGATSLAVADNNGVKEFTISSVNTDTGADLTASNGVLKTVDGDFQLKNAGNLSTNTISKWDETNKQFANSTITDDGTTVTIGGSLVVEGTTTTLNTTTLVVEDNMIELRKGNNLTANSGGIQINLTTDSGGTPVTYRQLQWFHTGGYWRSFDGSSAFRFVTETETQTLTNKTLTSPTLTSPSLGAATANSINGLEITSTASATLTMTDAKSLSVQRSLLLTSDNNEAEITVNFRTGGNVAYRSDTLSAFSSTTSTQLRALISDTTGTNKLVFQDDPTITSGMSSTSSGLVIFNSTVESITMGGDMTAMTLGADTGTTTINHSVLIKKDLTVGTDPGSGGAITDGDTTILGILNAEEQDILIRGSKTDPMTVGRGKNAVGSNTALGVGVNGNVTSGSQNTGVGYKSLFSVNTGAANTAYGVRALNQLGIGNNNISVGKDSSLNLASGNKNVAIGSNAMQSNTAGDANVCIGHYAGYGITGTGNVVIGPADGEDSTQVTYTLPQANGDRQLVIGSGSEAWIKGDSNFLVTLPNGLVCGGDCTIGGSLTVNGTVTTVNSNVVTVDDKAIELAAVTNTTFTATTNGTATLNGITPTAGLIPGMEVQSTTGGITIPAGTTILSLDDNTAVLSAVVTGSGQASIIAIGPSDLGANGGGIILKGTPTQLGGTGDKTIKYDHSRTDKYWTFSENLEIAFGKKFVIGNQLALDRTTLGATVVNSSLTTVGVLERLTTNGFLTIGGRVLEKTFQNFNTSLAPTSNVLTVNCSAANTILGETTTDAINTFAFITDNNDPSNPSVLGNGQSITITLIINANTAAIYGDACTVDGATVSNGIKWAGGSPPSPSSNFDILTFVIAKDNNGTINVFGQGNTDFS
jgi:hypothetical protein